MIDFCVFILIMDRSDKYQYHQVIGGGGAMTNEEAME